MRLGRIVGIAIGIVILLTVFFVPFAAIPGYVEHGETLFSAFSGALAGIPPAQSSGTAQEVAAVLVLAVAGLILTIAGVAGIFPLGTGALGVSGMAMLTFGPYFTGHASSLAGLTLDVGYYVLWAASILALAMAFVGREIPVLNRDIRRRTRGVSSATEQS